MIMYNAQNVMENKKYSHDLILRNLVVQMVCNCASLPFDVNGLVIKQDVSYWFVLPFKV